MGSLNFIGGEKGGVGKSVTARVLAQYFIDVSHWNNTRGKTEGIIDPDPDGSLHEVASALDRLLAAEKSSAP